MYNAHKPEKSELPSSAQLLRSTLLALIAAIVILVTVILPAEYALDPTGIGRQLGLTQMGEIKEQLAAEAEADRRMKQNEMVADAAEMVAKNVVVNVPEPAPEVSPAEVWRDEIRIDLSPGQGAEVKLVMKQGEVAEFYWISDGGPVNFDLHGDGKGRSISYEKGRGVPEVEGELTAEFTGNHGWFFRNRNKKDVAVTLFTKGEYSSMKRVL